jgi:hypothetical protein
MKYDVSGDSIAREETVVRSLEALGSWPTEKKFCQRIGPVSNLSIRETIIYELILLIAQ